LAWARHAFDELILPAASVSFPCTMARLQFPPFFGCV
jgi:hypothetical protein